MTLENNVRQYVYKSVELIQRAKAENQAVGVLGCVSRLYYACYHMCIAFILINDKRYVIPNGDSVHRKVRSEYNLHYNKTRRTRIYNKGEARLYLLAWHNDRIYADYEIYENDTIHHSKIAVIKGNIDEMIKFLNAHFDYLNANYDEQCEKIVLPEYCEV